ncbi:RNA-binding protein 41 [Ixodes scapularis]|uniref:RNA-binding protein 41 n=1 Tax=Ixodes scapularis TaxID=6945 RepID=UPI001A9D2346|nr:RNA-binding protein 41 [Ixodes scapularis]
MHTDDFSALEDPGSSRKRLKRHQRFELGTETESEKLLQQMLNRQLDTNFSMRQLAQQHKSFTPAGSYVQLPVAGACTLGEYISAGSEDQQKQQLLQYGLTDEEIQLYLQHTRPRSTEKLHPLMNPGVLEGKLDEIRSKIEESRRSQLATSEAFSGARQLTRSEMDVERTLYADCPERKHYKGLVVEARPRTAPLPTDPMSHVAEFSKALMERIKAKKKDRKCTRAVEDESSDKTAEEARGGDGDPRPDPTVFHAVVPLSEEEIRGSRLGVDEIRELPRFRSYSPGAESRVLYLKNLHAKTDLREIMALFCRYDQDGNAVKYRLLSGRLKGQAFVTLPSLQAARDAMELCNGYVLRGKPIVIEYGKQRDES